LEARIETNRKKDREDLKEMREEIKSGQAEMRSTVCAMRSELKETIQHGMKVVIQLIQSELDETTACNKATETEPIPQMMQSIEEHQDIPKGEAAVMPVENQGSGIGSAIWPRNAARRGSKGPGDIMDPGGSRLPPARGCPTMQKWHGEKGTSSGMFRSNESVDRGRNWVPAIG
jgi:hypothetical protein